MFLFFFFSSRRRHTRCLSDWSSDVCSSDLLGWKHVCQKMIVVMSRQSDANGNARGGDGGGCSPRRLTHDRDVVATSANRGNTAQKWLNRRARPMRRDGPERIRGDDVVDVRNEWCDGRRVLFAPDVDRRVGKR